MLTWLSAGENFNEFCRCESFLTYVVLLFFLHSLSVNTMNHGWKPVKYLEIFNLYPVVCWKSITWFSFRVVREEIAVIYSWVFSAWDQLVRIKSSQTSESIFAVICLIGFKNMWGSSNKNIKWPQKHERYESLVFMNTFWKHKVTLNDWMKFPYHKAWQQLVSPIER